MEPILEESDNANVWLFRGISLIKCVVCIVWVGKTMTLGMLLDLRSFVMLCCVSCIPGW